MIRHTHIIGIGGAAMSAIATLLQERGEHVSGCDRSASYVLERLSQKGIQTFIGHAPEHLEGVDRVLITSALPEDHPELQAARQQGLLIMTRHDLWREWSLQRPTVAISGTHGKTTTTAMTAVIFNQVGRDVGYLIGAEVPALQRSSYWGSAELIIEADEYARTFLSLKPQTVAITNIDWDHVDIYNSQQDYDAAFYEFMTSTSIANRILCGDDLGLRRVADNLPAIWCGLSPQNDWQASQIRFTPQGSYFLVKRAGRELGSVNLHVPGLHNVRNALLALAIAFQHGIDFPLAAQALEAFTGSARRFEHKGVVNNIDVIDDYAHHPTEIQATLAAARAMYPDRRLVVYFQPHTFSRLQAFKDGFLTSFDQADVVRIGDVFGAREVSSVNISEQFVYAMNHDDVATVGEPETAAQHLATIAQSGDVVLTLGAGDSVLVGEYLLRYLEQS